MGSRGPTCITVPSFGKISQTVFEIWQFFDFSRWRPSAILNLFGAYLDHPRRTVGGLYHYAKFACDRCSNFDNMKVWIFGAFGLKMPIHVPKVEVLENLTPKWAALSMKPPKDTSLRESASFEPSSSKIRGLIWSVDEFLKRGYK